MKLSQEQVDGFGSAPCQECEAARAAREQAPPAAGPTGPSVVTMSPNKPAWIAVSLVDEAGAPMPGAKFRVTFPDGGALDGLLDKNGKVRIEGIDPGSCQVTFPDRDAKEWEPA